MIRDFQTKRNRLKKPKHQSDLGDWQTALAFIGLLVLMKFAVDVMVFWIDYSIISLHNF